MTSYVFTVIKKRFLWEKVYNILTEKYGDNFELVFAVRQSCAEKDDLLQLEKKQPRVKVLQFEDSASENKMVSGAIKQTSGQDMVLCRDGFDYQTIKSDYLLAMGAYGGQVALFRQQPSKNKFVGWAKKLLNKVVKYIFGFVPYGGDVGLMYFSNLALDVLKSVPNSALLTKVNKWVGFSVTYVEIDEIDKQTHEKKELKPLIVRAGVFALLLYAAIKAFVWFSVRGKLSFIAGLGLVFASVLSGFFLVYLSAKIFIVNKYGDLKE